MAPYRILSLDGGGIRGVLTATLLERFEAVLPGFMTSVDLIAGTSTGGILALGLASGLSPTQARELYEACGNQVFKDTLLDDLRDLGQLTGADYTNAPLKTLLAEQFGEQTLADLPKKVVISAFDLDNEPREPGKVRTWKAKFFHNFPGPDSDGDQKVVDVALRTSAAPTFFPIYQGFIDGGVIANNPSMCAVAQSLHPKTGGQKMRNIRLLSVGTGTNPRYLTIQDANWGLLKWAPHLVSLMMEGSVNLADYQCKQLLNQRYLRVNPLLPRSISLDKIGEIPLLKLVAHEFDLTEAVKWLKHYFKPM